MTDVSRTKKGTFDLAFKAYKEWQGVVVNFPENKIMKSVTSKDASLSSIRSNNETITNPSSMNRSRTSREISANIHLEDGYVYGFGNDDGGFYTIRGDLNLLHQVTNVKESSIMSKEVNLEHSTIANLVFCKKYLIKTVESCDSRDYMVFYGQVAVNKKAVINKKEIYQLESNEIQGFCYNTSQCEFGKFVLKLQDNDLITIKTKKKVNIVHSITSTTMLNEEKLSVPNRKKESKRCRDNSSSKVKSNVLQCHNASM